MHFSKSTNLPLPCGDLHPQLPHGSLAQLSPQSRGTSIGSSVIAGLTLVTDTDRQTDTQTDHATTVARGRIFAFCTRDAA